MTKSLTAREWARTFYLALMDAPDHPSTDMALAAEQTRNHRLSRKPPHAPISTPPRPRNQRDPFTKKLLKGHRV